MKQTSHTCPRDCFDACGMIAHVNDRGRLVKVSGDTRHRYTNGKLCCKGYAYTQYVYHPDRIIYPMRQFPRNSGNWERISWEEANEIICNKIIDINKKYHSFLPIAYMKGGGNYGVMSEATKGLFTSLGPISIVNIAGAICLASAWDAQLLDFGNYISPPPMEMAKANTVILWGINPVVTATHQIPMIEKVKARGGKVILIDVYPSKSKVLADQFIQVKPGGDGALALAILKTLLLLGKINFSSLKEYSGWQLFSEWLINAEFSFLNEVSGVDGTVVEQLAKELAKTSQVAFWLGTGLQRYSNGGQNIRNIHALAVAIGSVDSVGGGIYFARKDHWQFNYSFNHFTKHDDIENRYLGINSLAKNLSECKEPPIEMLWMTSCNPLDRCSDVIALREQVKVIDFVVTVDHFLTTSAKASDLVLPATTCFEAWDIVASYWHHWIGLNQPAIEPVGDCRSELQIAKSLSKRLSELKPGLTSFPWKNSDDEWLSKEFSDMLKQNLQITSYQSLLDGARPLQLVNEQKNNYRFKVPEAMLQGNPELPILVSPIEPPKTYPLRFLLLHRTENLNSQLTNIAWLKSELTDVRLFLSPNVASKKGIVSGQKVVVYNHLGEVHLIAKVMQSLSDEIVICYSPYDMRGESINVLVGEQETDLGRHKFQYPGVAFYDTFVNVGKSHY